MAKKTNKNNVTDEVDNGGNQESRNELSKKAAENGMKKGPWTPQEDSILIEYVNKYDEGNWNSVQKNSGLSRCGKSCRLRWTNHLKPNLKKGAFSDQEEKIILHLHSQLGNKWSQMAAQLPGRTDNEIKNFWNTRLKRRQRAGLSIYPSPVQDKEKEATSYLQQQQKQNHFEKPNITSSSSTSFSILLSSCYPKNLQEPAQYSSLNPLPTPLNNNNNNNPASYTDSGNGNKNVNLTLLSSPNGSSPSSTNFFSNSAIPLSPPGSETPDSSYSGGGGSSVDGGGLMGVSSMVNDCYEVAPLLSPQVNNSGLLDAVVIGTQGLSCSNEKSNCDEDSTIARRKLSYKRKIMALEEYDDGNNKDESFTALVLESAPKRTRNTSTETQTGKKVASEDPLVEEMNNSIYDELFSILNNFPSQTLIPEWNRRGGSDHQSLGLETQADNASVGPTDQEFSWSLEAGWMPGLC